MSTQHNWVCDIQVTEWGSEDKGFKAITDCKMSEDFVLLDKKSNLGLRASYNFRVNYSIVGDQYSECYAETSVSCV